MVYQMNDLQTGWNAIGKRSSERLCAPLYQWLVQAVVEFVGLVGDPRLKSMRNGRAWRHKLLP